ncbi:MAG TPA: acyltransferase [Lysobacter sp.]
MSVDRRDNFHFVRLLAASAVLFSHQFAFERLPEPLVLKYQTLGGFGVLVFFAISGFLVAQSWERDPNLLRFAQRRLLRIWPGMICTILLCGLVLGPIVTTVPVSQYFADPTTHRFFGGLVFMIQPFLPGVFPDSLVAGVPNGVLWTIPLELRCYLYLSIFGMLGILRYRWIVLGGLLAVSVFYYGIYGAEARFDQTYQHWYELQYATFFFSGACIYYFRDAWNTRTRKLALFVAASIVGVVLAKQGHELIAAFVMVPTLTILFGTESFPVLRDFDRFGDLSFGIYIYAFPIQQTIVWLMPGAGILVHLAIAVPLTLVLAYASWHLVEKLALQYKPRTPRSLSVSAPVQGLGETLAVIRKANAGVYQRVTKGTGQQSRAW